MKGEEIVKHILLEAGNLDHMHRMGVQICERELKTLRDAFTKAKKDQLETIHPTTRRFDQCEALLAKLEAIVATDSEAKTNDDEEKELQGTNQGWVAPWRVPHHRFMQTFCVSCFCFFTGPPVALTLTVLFLLFPPTMPLMIAYIAYILFVPLKHPLKKKHGWIHNQFWDYYRDYFPVRLAIPRHIRRQFTATDNYMFVYHPHGVHCFGAIVNFGTESNDVHKLLPGLKVHCQTLKANFSIPFWREIGVSVGCGDASASTLRKTLSAGPGESVLLVVGGAEESLLSAPHKTELTLHKRKGFCKIALECGSPLVPVFSFGETSVYGNFAEGHPKLQKTLAKLQKKLGFGIPMISGRGYFNYNWGVLPHRRPIVTVVGAPIPVEKVAKPTQEQIDALHATYCDALVGLFNEHKDVYDALGQPIHLN